MHARKLVVLIAGIYCQFSIAGDHFYVGTDKNTIPLVKVDGVDKSLADLQKQLNQAENSKTFLNHGNPKVVVIHHLVIGQTPNTSTVVAKDFISSSASGYDIDLDHLTYAVPDDHQAYFLDLNGQGRVHLNRINADITGTAVRVYNPNLVDPHQISSTHLTINDSKVTSESNSAVVLTGDVEAKITQSHLSSYSKNFNALVVEDGAKALLVGGSVTQYESKNYHPAIYIKSDGYVSAKGTFIGINPSQTPITTGRGYDNTVYLDNQATFDADGSVINVDTKVADGVVLFGASQSSTANFSNNTQIILNKEHARGIRSFNGNVNVASNGLGIVADGANSQGLSIRRNAQTHVNGMSINMIGKASSGIFVETSKLNAQNFNINHSQVQVTNGDAIKLEKNAGLMNFDHFSARVTTGNVISINNANQDAITLHFSNANLNGDVVSKNANSHIQLEDKSILNGGIQHLSSLNIGKNSAWVMTKDSSIDSDLENDGVVKFGVSNPQFKTLNIGGALAGRGQYDMNISMGELKHDQIQVRGQVLDKNMLLLRDAGVSLPNGEEKLTLVSAAGNNQGEGQFNLLNQGAYVDIGNYKYALVEHHHAGQGVSWILEKTMLDSDAVKIARNIGALDVSQSLWGAPLATLRQRMSELRQTPSKDGMWVRTYGDRTKLKNQTHSNINQTQNSVSIGADHELTLDSGYLWVGAKYSHVKAKQDLGLNATGKARSNSFGVYLSYLSHKQTYLDLLVTSGKQHQTMAFTQTDGKAADASFDQKTMGVSIELGKQIALNNNWFIEPQTQLNYFHAEKVLYTMSNGANVDMASGNALTGRVGTLLGKNYTTRGGAIGQWYTKLGVNKQFSAAQDILVNQKAYRVSNHSASIYAGVGVKQSIGKNSSIYADIGFEKGHAYSKPWSYSLGLRKTW